MNPDPVSAPDVRPGTEPDFDPEEMAERIAIMVEDGGLSVEEAERRARTWYAPVPCR